LHLYRFIWLLVLPFGIFPEASWWALVPVSVMALMMLGLEDATAQMEDPFKFIPYGGYQMRAICEVACKEIGKSCMSVAVKACAKKKDAKPAGGNKSNLHNVAAECLSDSTAGVSLTHHHWCIVQEHVDQLLYYGSGCARQAVQAVVVFRTTIPLFSNAHVVTFCAAGVLLVLQRILLLPQPRTCPRR
jgi:hypothetical protein